MQTIKLKDIYQTKELLFIGTDKISYFNGADQTLLSAQAQEGLMYYHNNFAVCKNIEESLLLDYLVLESKVLILDMLGFIEEDKKINLEEKYQNSDWEVIFTNNSTSAINKGISLVSDYMNKEYENNFNVSYNPLCRNSALLSTFRSAKQYNLYHEEVEKSIDMDKRIINKPKRLVVMPYIDNLVGLNHFKYFYSKITQRHYFAKQNDNYHIMLDATQAGYALFNPNKKSRLKLHMLSAITFAGDKFFSSHLGVLVIRKRYTETHKPFEGISDIGWATIKGYYQRHGTLNTPIFMNKSDYLQGGTPNSATILGLGAWLDYLSKQTFDSEQYVEDMTTYLRNAIEQTCDPTIQVVKIPHFSELNNPLYGKCNITLIKSRFTDNLDLFHRLTEKGFEIRNGNFCVDYGAEKFGVENCIRITVDLSTSEKELKYLVRCLQEIHQDYLKIISNQEQQKVVKF